MSADRPERRIDPYHRMDADFHAARALERFRDFTAPEDIRTSLDEVARFRNAVPHLGEAETMRAAMLKLVSRLDGKLSPEQLAFRESLESQAGAATSVWTKKFPIKNGPSQDQLESSAHSWLQTLSPQVLDGFRALCPDTASLVVVPNLPVPTLLELLKEGGANSSILLDYWEVVNAGIWKVGVTDGTEDIPFDNAIYWEDEKHQKSRTNKAMVAKYKELFEAHGLNLMPPHGYVPSSSRALAEGNVLDRKFYTAFEKPKGETFLPFGDWGDIRLDLGGHNPDLSYGVLRCRPWFEGDLKF